MTDIQMSGAKASISSVPEADEMPKRFHWTIDLFIQLIKTKPLGTFGLGLVIFIVLVAIFAPQIAPYAAETMHGSRNLLPPSSEFLFGTDPLARDFFSRIVYGARTSLKVAIIVIVLQVLVSTFVGTMSGYIGGFVDTAIQRVVDTLMCIPWMVFMLLMMAILGPGTGNLIFAMVMVGWASSSRVIRATVLSVKESEFVLSARAAGAKEWVIVVYHILPNIMAPIIVLSTLGLGNVILAEAALSFLGFGIQPPNPSWGRMLSQDGMDYMLLSPGLAVFPGIAISLAVFGFNMLGDALRDLLDPRLQGGK